MGGRFVGTRTDTEQRLVRVRRDWLLITITSKLSLHSTKGWRPQRRERTVRQVTHGEAYRLQGMNQLGRVRSTYRRD